MATEWNRPNLHQKKCNNVLSNDFLFILCPKFRYKMMLDCWQPKPTMRPTFCKLSERLGSMLEDSVRKVCSFLNFRNLIGDSI